MLLAHRTLTGRALSDGSIGTEPRALRGGNVPAVFNVAHWLRDERLCFSRGYVRLLAGQSDTHSGLFAIGDGGEADVVVVGGGLAGLTTAWDLKRSDPDLRVRLIDARPWPGGNAGVDAGAPLPVPAATAGAYASVPENPAIIELYRDIGLEWEQWVVPEPFYSYCFDGHTPWATARRWVHDPFGAGIETLPYSTEIRTEIRAIFEAARHTTDEMMPDPALLGVSFAEHLRDRHPAVLDLLTRFTVDALGGTPADINAHAALAFLGAETRPRFAPPGGTGSIALALARRLSTLGVIPESQTIGLRVEPDGGVIVWRQGQFLRIRGRAVVVATGGSSARFLAAELLDASAQEAWSRMAYVPVVTANVVLRRARPLLDLGLGFNPYWWGSRCWADFCVADWTGSRRNDPDRATVLTFYGANHAPAERLAEERVALLQTPIEVYEASIRDDLTRVLSGSDFDPERDLGEIFVYRWGHGMVLARPWAGTTPPVTASQPVGPVAFAGQDVGGGTPSVESAFASAFRAADQVRGLRR